MTPETEVVLTEIRQELRDEHDADCRGRGMTESEEDFYKLGLEVGILLIDRRLRTLPSD